MNRLHIFLAAGVIFSSPVASEVCKAAPTLQESVTVASDIVVLGDVVTEAGSATDVPLARAPEPGKQIRISVGQVFALASANGVQLTAPRGIRSVTIQRASRLVERQEIIDAVRTAFEMTPAGMSSERIEVTLSGPRPNLHVSTESMPVFEVSDIEYNRRIGTFRAKISVSGPRRLTKTASIRGHALSILSIPVLSHRLGRGEMISPSDIEWIEVHSNKISSDIITDENDLIGYVPRGNLRPGNPVRTTSVQLPTIIERDALVTVIYQIPGLTVTSQGKSLEPGHLNKLIRIQNTHSDRIIYAKVISPNQAIVPNISRQIAAR